KGKVVKCSVTERVGKNDISEAKALAALKNHSEAEKRRRERINGHLATLRGLVTSTDQKNFLKIFYLKIVIKLAYVLP
ncbi:transcription factor bHLH30-like, partial [Trifolium medium]|nr:transcription factor bHLH30-like [Trifolium medium]